MNALTTCFGFRSLVLAEHTGWMTLGFIVGAGILWLPACALILRPAVWAWWQGAAS